METEGHMQRLLRRKMDVLLWQMLLNIKREMWTWMEMLRSEMSASYCAAYVRKQN